MLKHKIQRLLPAPHVIKKSKILRFLSRWLNQPSLWHINRRSVSGAFAVGLFMAFVPFPIQMIGAALLAIIMRVNLAIAVALVWLTNPLTIPPMFFFAYAIGCWVLGLPVYHASFFHPDMSTLQRDFGQIWQPLLLGCLIVGSLSAILGFICIRLYWRFYVTKRWHQRTYARHSNKRIS
ncbi:DUF2062 domain-containing protein [Acidihalobacter prosperus]